MNTKVLVTGANGQLGLTIEELFKENSDHIDFVFHSRTELDITNIDQLKSQFSKQNFDYCINCAAYTNVEQAEKTPEIAYKINSNAVKHLSNICKDTNVVLIHISTDYVFDGEKHTPYSVIDKPNPINEYGKSKLLGEQYIQELLDEYFIIRTSWLYSKKYGNNFYKTIIKKANEETDIVVTTEQIGCPTNTESLSRFIFQLIIKKNKDYGVFHFCDEKAMTWYDFAEEILKENRLLNKINLVKAGNYSTFAARPKSSILSVN